MWLKLINKKWWIALCILVTIGPFLKDLRRISPKTSSFAFPISASRPESVTLHRVPRGYQEIQPPTEEVARIHRIKPIVALQGVTVLADGSRVQRIDKGWQKHMDPSLLTEQGTESNYVQSVRHTGLKTEAFGYMIRPDWGNWRLTSNPELKSYPTGNVIEGEVWFRPLSQIKPAASYAVAWKSEARTVVEQPLPSHSGIIFGPTLDFQIKEISQGVFASLTISKELRSQFCGQDLIYKLYAIDRAGKSHESESISLDDLDDRDSDGYVSQPHPIQVIYPNLGKDQIQSLRLVAAPLHWVEFRDVPSTLEEKMASKGIYLIPAVVREKLRISAERSRDSRYAGSAVGTVFIEATNFPPAMTAHAVPDAVVVCSGTPDNEENTHDDNTATFTIFMPRYLGDRTLSVSVYDSREKHATRQSYTKTYPPYYVTGLHLAGEEAKFATYVVHRFPGFRQNDIRRIVITTN